MYYGSESFNEKEFTKDKAKNSKFGKIYLYKATKQGDTWSNSKPLPFNNKEYDVRNPSISKDGKRCTSRQTCQVVLEEKIFGKYP